MLEPLPQASEIDRAPDRRGRGSAPPSRCSSSGRTSLPPAGPPDRAPAGPCRGNWRPPKRRNRRRRCCVRRRWRRRPSAIQALWCMRRLTLQKRRIISSPRSESAVAAADRVEQPHLDIGMRVDRAVVGIAAPCVDVVEQQPDTDAAIGGLDAPPRRAGRRSDRPSSSNIAGRGCARRCARAAARSAKASILSVSSRSPVLPGFRARSGAIARSSAVLSAATPNAEDGGPSSRAAKSAIDRDCDDGRDNHDRLRNHPPHATRVSTRRLRAGRKRLATCPALNARRLARVARSGRRFSRTGCRARRCCSRTSMAWVAATQASSPPPSVQTGQSLPQTTRSQPKQSMTCST